MNAPVRVERDGTVAVVILDRPEAMNALDIATKEALLETLASLDEVARRREVRALVLTGTGRAFCAGQDLREHATALSTEPATALATVTRHYNPLVTALAGFPAPTLAAVNGVAAGAGAGLACACDLRIFADTARLAAAFAGIGLAPDTGLSWTLPRLIGPARAAQLLLLGAPLLATQALAWGVATEVVPAAECLTRARELAAQLAAGPTAAYLATREALTAAATSTLAQALSTEARLQATLGATQDHPAAVAAFLERRPATFTGR